MSRTTKIDDARATAVGVLSSSVSGSLGKEARTPEQNDWRGSAGNTANSARLQVSAVLYNTGASGPTPMMTGVENRLLAY